KTPEYLQTLSRYKVAICTASAYGYALRKIIEATACGCVVITDLQEELPWIDDNLVRISPDITEAELAELIKRLLSEYDPDHQEWLSKVACGVYGYQCQAAMLSIKIQLLRARYAVD